MKDLWWCRIIFNTRVNKNEKCWQSSSLSLSSFSSLLALSWKASSLSRPWLRNAVNFVMRCVNVIVVVIIVVLIIAFFCFFFESTRTTQHTRHSMLIKVALRFFWQYRWSWFCENKSIHSRESCEAPFHRPKTCRWNPTDIIWEHNADDVLTRKSFVVFAKQEQTHNCCGQDTFEYNAK